MSIWCFLAGFAVGGLLGILVMAALAGAGWDDAFMSGYREAMSRINLDGLE